MKVKVENNSRGDSGRLMSRWAGGFLHSYPPLMGLVGCQQGPAPADKSGPSSALASLPVCPDLPLPPLPPLPPLALHSQPPGFEALGPWGLPF